MSSWNWGDVPTWITAVTTIAAAGLAAWGAITAWRQVQAQADEQDCIAALQGKQLEQLERQAALRGRYVS